MKVFPTGLVLFVNIVFKGDPRLFQIQPFGLSLHRFPRFPPAGQSGGLIGGRIWRYELEPSGEGTLVRETWDVSQDKQKLFLKKGSMPDNTGKAMTKTLKRLAELLER